MKASLLVVLLILSIPVHALERVKCQGLKWRLAEKGEIATYRGSVKAGSASVIDIEVWRSNKIIGQSYGYPNAVGNWEAVVFADRRVKRSHKVRIYCSK